MIKKHESEAGRSLVVFPIQILLISKYPYNFLDFNSTAMKFRLIYNISMLFQMISMMSLITEGKMLFLRQPFAN
jgi:hypothetical protein